VAALGVWLGEGITESVAEAARRSVSDLMSEVLMNKYGKASLKKLNSLCHRFLYESCSDGARPLICSDCSPCDLYVRPFGEGDAEFRMGGGVFLAVSPKRCLKSSKRLILL
jgi:hypothetical protein